VALGGDRFVGVVAGGVLAGVGATAELDATDDVVAAAAGAVLVPLAVNQSAGDGDRAALVARYFAQASA
jgi:hypothetical protein